MLQVWRNSGEYAARPICLLKTGRLLGKRVVHGCESGISPAAFGPRSPVVGGDIYVGPEGSDSNPGTADAPVSSLQAALKRCGRGGGKCANIFATGAVVVNETVVIPAAVQAGLTIDRWPGRPRPTFSGGVTISAAQWRLEAGVWKAELAAGSLAAAAMRKRPGAIHVDGVRREVRRSAMLRWNHTLGEAGDPANLHGFVFSDGDFKPEWDYSAAATASWTVAVFHSWVKGYHKVGSVDMGNRTLMLGNAAKFPFGAYEYCSDRRYYVENVPELGIAPGTFLWRSSGVDGAVDLEYMDAADRGGRRAAPPTVVVPSTETLIKAFTGGDLTLQNLNFSDTAISCDEDACDADLGASSASAIQLGHLTGAVTLHNLSFVRCTGYAVHATDAPGLSATRMLMQDMGAGGVFVSNSPFANVSNNVVSGFGKRIPAGVGVNVASCPNSTVSHNEIFGGLYNGLTGESPKDSGKFTNFSYNHVHSNGWGGDMGICDYSGIHVSTTGAKLPIFIAHNVFRNITAFHNGGGGIYLDVTSTAIQVEANLVHSTTYSPFQWHVNPGVPPPEGPQVPTRVTNNVFVSNAQSAFYVTKGMAAIHWDGWTPSEFSRNVIAIDPTAAASTTAAFEGSSCLKFLPTNTPPGCTDVYLNTFKRADFHSNMWWNGTQALVNFPGGGDCHRGGCATATFREWQGESQGSDSVVQDPLFKDAVGGDFTVTSPAAAKLGIVPLDLRHVGPDWSPDDAEWQKVAGGGLFAS